MNSVRFILSHTPEAAMAALLFFIGVLLAPVVYARRMESFLAFPRWLMGKLRGFIAEGPSIPRLALMIFAFNGTAIFLYMITGLIPGVPMLIALCTGMNVALAGLLAREQRPASGPALRRSMPASVRLCAVLTFLLELPSFWFAIGMSFTMPNILFGFEEGDAAGILRRVEAYVMVILPTLLLSATVESYAVLWATRNAPDST